MTEDTRKIEATRAYRMVAVLGAPGSGKTSLIDEHIARADAAGREVLIIDPARQWPGRGVWPEIGRDGSDTRSPEERGEDVITALRRKRRALDARPRAGLLVLDDCDVYLGGGHPRGVWRELFATFRHWHLDVIVSARRTQDVPKIVFTSASFLAIFRHREAHSLAYMSEYIGADAVKLIPREPFRYLWVNVDAPETASEHRTKPRNAKP